MRAGDEASSAICDCRALAGDEEADAIVAAECMGVSGRRPGVVHYIIAVEELCEVSVGGAFRGGRGRAKRVRTCFCAAIDAEDDCIVELRVGRAVLLVETDLWIEVYFSKLGLAQARGPKHDNCKVYCKMTRDVD